MKWNNKKSIHLIIDIMLLGILIFVDQFTKYQAVKYLKDKPAKVLINRVFELNYLENRGAAFGMFQNQKILFVIIAILMLLAVGYVLFKMPMTKKYGLLEFILVFISAGAIGNMIDRVKMNYVVDFFYFILINFPIFNVADIYVSVSCVILAILILFYYKEEDFAFITKRKIKES